MDKVLMLLLALAGCGTAPAGVIPEALAEPQIGAAYYGIQNKDWPCKASLAALKDLKRPAVSFVWSSFGREEACLRKFLDDMRPKLLQIQAINECCIRRGSCVSHELGHGYSVSSFERAISSGDPKLYKKIDLFLRPAALLVAAYRGSNMKCLITPGLESNLSAGAQQKLIKFMRPFFPQCEFVSYGVRVKGADYVETHTAQPATPPCVLANDDGKWPSSSLSSWKAAGRKCRAFFIWHPQFNGWRRQATQTPDPRKRSNWPTPPVFDWLRANL